MLLAASRMLFPDAREPVPGYLRILDERITEVGVGTPPQSPDEHVDGLVVPGYVDVHCHGGGGASFVTEDPAVARQAIQAHRSRGVTTMVASLVSDAIPALTRQVGCLAGLVEAGELAGVHLEGPWLSGAHAGAHAPELLCDPEPASVAELLDAGRGTVRMVTLAPERPHAMAAITLLRQRGVVAAIGHTDADFETTQRAIEAGATGATHLFNAMAPLHHRAPGPILALWADPRVYLELIMDGVHVRPELVAFVMNDVPDRAVLITDAIAAAGAGDGEYVLGKLPVTVKGGVARVTGTDTIAGSTLTLDRAVRNAVTAGVPLASAIRSATQLPADYLGLADVGRLSVGAFADLAVLNEDVEVIRVMRRGHWL